MAAVIVQIKRNIKAKKEAQEARLARFPRSAKPNENDIILNSAEYDEDIDDAMHEKELTPWVLLNGMIWDCQPWAKQVYADIRVQMFVAVLILGNFVVNIIEKQVWPSGKVCELKSYEWIQVSIASPIDRVSLLRVFVSKSTRLENDIA